MIPAHATDAQPTRTQERAARRKRQQLRRRNPALGAMRHDGEQCRKVLIIADARAGAHAAVRVCVKNGWEF